MVKTAGQLKSELQTLVETIVNGDGFALEDSDRALQTLRSLRALKLTNSETGAPADELGNLPPEFRCPISGKIMIDPVVVHFGQTYDRAALEEWIEKGNERCPKTKQPLASGAHVVLIPNLMVQDMILKWLKEKVNSEAYETHILLILLAKLSSSDIDHRKKAAKEIRERARDSHITKTVFGKIQDAIPQMIRALSWNNDLNVEEDSISALYHISRLESNKQLFADHSEAIPVIIKSLKSINVQTRRQTIATLLSLSSLESNKLPIGESGGLKLLVELVHEAHIAVTKGAVSVIFNLCSLRENRTRAVADGAAPAILQNIKDHGNFVGDLLSLLELLCSEGDGVTEMVEADAVPILLGIMRARKGEQLNKEKALSIICSICSVDSRQLRPVDRNELKNKTLKDLFQHGTATAKEKAHALLQRLFHEPSAI